MRVLQSTSADPSGVLGAALSNIRNLAEQVICYSEDMEYAPNRLNLKRLPAAWLLKPPLQNLLPHNNKDMQEILHIVANEKGFTIQYDKDFRGPQIMWLQSSGLLTTENRLWFSIILQRPKSRGVGPEVGHEPVSRCSIKTPVAQEQYVNSSFQCRVGDIIIVEEGEELWVDDSIESRGICLLGTLYQIEWKDPSLKNFQ